MQRPIKSDYLNSSNQYNYQEKLNEYYEALEKYIDDMDKQKTQRELELEVENFNLKHKVGDKVLLKNDAGEVNTVTVKSPATILGGHTAVGWFKEISGCYLLERVITDIKVKK